MYIDPMQVDREARQEMAVESFREAVENRKEEIRRHVPLWHRIFPWRITIHRR